MRAAVSRVQSLVQGEPYTSSLLDCNHFIDQFDYTINTRYQGVPEKMKPYQGNNYETITCDFPGPCPDGVTRPACTWLRFLTVTCEISGDGALITILTNSMPNHCYRSDSYYPKGDSGEYQFYGMNRIQWNLKPREMAKAAINYDNKDFYFTDLRSQADIDGVLCIENWAQKELLDTNVHYAEVIKGQTQTSNNWKIDSSNVGQFNLLGLPNSDAVVGIALNGVFLFSGTSKYGYDAYFPRAYGLNTDPRQIEFDVCLGSVESYNTYRYHMYSPCIYETSIRTKVMMCKEDGACSFDLRTYAAANTPVEARVILPIGLAKDGRVIYGPYRQDRQLWQPCDVDICNGRYFGTYYGYVATMFHPYILGCFGPSNTVKNYYQQCSSNAKICAYAQTNFSFSYITLALLSMVLFFTSIY
ncbi:UNKNOWN [Stylonychia lemnae]|uniref:YHYH domain-containing protein n=1 Tax=Stylonychia lemnae TaxID=5949 RepID=A0A078B798_STYLE|nr:UNKNOWN [Stylonychia lemnae]|eukprot:CDW90076.1 UNKNOWN [Stylonychia lemnae]